MAFITSYWEIKSKQDIRAEVINMIGQQRETLTPSVPKAGGFVQQAEHRWSRQGKVKRFTVAKYRTRVSAVNQLPFPAAWYFVTVLMLLFGVFWLSSHLPPATKLGQGYIFTGVCDSVRGGGCLLWRGAWSQGETPQDGYCCGWYTSYWNAVL